MVEGDCIACSVGGCNKAAVTKALCPMHYQRLRLHGTTDPRPAQHAGHCALCGTGYTSSRKRLYCGRKCAERAQYVKQGRLTREEYLASNRREGNWFTCEHCGVAAHRTLNNRAERNRFCSMSCRVEAAAKLRAIRAKNSRKVVRTFHGHCDTCGKHYQQTTPVQRYCGEECRPSPGMYTAWEPESRECVGCGHSFVQSRKWQRRCKAECRTEAEAAGRRRAKAKRRAVMRGAEADSIDPLVVFERDGWRCHLCQRLTRKELRGTSRPEAPELDHMVSLADGGTHTWGNVACACRRCNHAKGAKSVGQLGLALAA